MPPPRSRPMMNADSLKSAPSDPALLRDMIREAEVISFDFFDTLFLRPLCDPEDLFDILGQRLGLADFRLCRRQAQALAFENMHRRGRREITLRDIYDGMATLPRPAHEVMALEQELELELLFPNPELVPLYREALAQGKRVVILSDMYLNTSFFLACLRRHGLPEVPVLVSSDQNATKRDDGALFAVLIQQVNVSPDRVLHVGDNPHADVRRAGELGLRTFLYREPVKPTPVEKGGAPATSVARALIRLHRESLPPDSFQELGFRYGGPAALGFLEWIAEQARADAIDHLLFLSRDGHILHQLADDGAPVALPRHVYFTGSRVAFNLAAMGEDNFTDFLPFLLSGAHGLSPCELLERLGVTPPASRVMADLGLPDDQPITGRQEALLTRFLWACRWDILKVCRRNRQALFRYLHSLGIQAGDRVAIVDVGWNGTTQEAFERAVIPMLDLHVTGYYFCLSTAPECLSRQGRHRMKAMVSTTSTSPDQVNRLYDNRVLVELFFSAPHHSIIGWQMRGDMIEPVEDPGRRESAGLLDHVASLQTGMMDFARSYRELRRRTGFGNTPMDIAQPLLEFAGDGRWRRLPILADVKNFDAWGSSRNRDILLGDY